MKCRIRRSKVRRGIGLRREEVEYDADRDASVWGDMERTGVRAILSDVGSSDEERMKSRTSLCDCIVIRMDWQM